MKKYIEKFKSLDSKQKTKVGAVVFLSVIVLWQIPSLFDNGVNTPAPSQAKAAPTTKIAQPSHTLKQSKVETKANATLITPAKQKEYLDSLDQLQMLKVQQQIAQTKQAIITAQLTTEQAQGKIDDMNSPHVAPPVPVAQYAKNLVKPGQDSQASNSGDNEQSHHSSSSSSHSPYKLLYISNVMGQWKAIIGSGGKLYNVTVGSKLPDGSLVKDISNSQVTLNHNGSYSSLAMTPDM